MEKNNEILSNALTNFILTDDFLTRFIVDNVKEKIYNERTYSVSMIESILINDLDNSSDSYILGFIADEIDIHQIAYRVDDKYGSDFHRLARQCNQ